MTCEGCKGFFRRAMKRNAGLRCPYRKGTCEITRKTRRQCQACRLRKCLESGMKKEMIMSDAAVEQRRALIKRRKRERIGTQPSGMQGLTEEQRMMIRELMDAQMKTFDTTFSHFKNFRLPEVLSSGHEIPGILKAPTAEEAAKLSQIRQDMCSVKVSLQLRGEDGSIWNYKPPADNSGKEIFSLLPHIADMSTYMFQGIINFAKVLSYFRDLPIEDQISLLKGATFELCQLRFNTVFNAEKGTWECGRLSYCLEDAAGGFQQFLLEPMLKFHYMLKKLQLHEEEPPRCDAARCDRPAAGAIRHYPEGLHRVLSAPARPPVPVPEDHGNAHRAPQHQCPAHPAAAAHPGHTPLCHPPHAGVVQHHRWLSTALGWSFRGQPDLEPFELPLLGLDRWTPLIADNALLSPPPQGTHSCGHIWPTSLRKRTWVLATLSSFCGECTGW
ncbi:nuclear receptor subfamily 1 group I member 2 isoform X3 [Lemur catta]|nr:nuclear receptor subfamily 1 group I member 2 isoform X3 [Lemur catta]